MNCKGWVIILLILVISNNCYSQNQATNRTPFGQSPPGDTAVLFAPEVFNHPEGYHSALIFTYDMKDVYFSPMTHYGEVHMIRDIWQNRSSDKIEFPSLCDIGDPFLSPDNKRLYFLSFQAIASEPSYRERIWFSEIVNGQFTDPKVVDEAVYAHPTHWQFSVAENYNLYFTSEVINDENQDIYLARYHQGEYLDPVALPEHINTNSRELCPFISPAEDYLIFARSGPATDKADLFICFKKKGEWADVFKLPASINSGGNDLCPVVSPDGKYLFFISTRDGISKIYWVSTQFIDRMK